MNEMVIFFIKLRSGDSFAESSLGVLQAEANVLLDSTWAYEGLLFDVGDASADRMASTYFFSLIHY